jgi:putative flippase GtrA
MYKAFNRMIGKLLHNPKFGELVRFAIVGIIALVILYVVYYFLLQWVHHNIAYTVGYVISFLCNYVFTVTFTFKTRATKKNGIGFMFSHLVNYLLQIGCLNLFLYLGATAQYAPFFVFVICVPVNFLLVRYFMKLI